MERRPVQADISDMNESVLQSPIGDEDQVRNAVAAFLGASWDANPLSVHIPQARSDLRTSITEAVRTNLRMIAPKSTHLHEMAFSDSSITIHEAFQPAWVLVNPDLGRLALCFWSSESTLRFRTIDTKFINIFSHQLWSSIGFWHPDVGDRDDELGLFVADVMFELHQNSEWLNLSLAPTPNAQEIARRIADLILPPYTNDETIAVLYLLGIPSDGSLGEDDFASLAQVSDVFEWMSNLVIDSPPACLDELRSFLTSRTSGVLHAVLESLHSTLGLVRRGSQDLDWRALLRDIGDANG